MALGGVPLDCHEKKTEIFFKLVKDGETSKKV